MPRKSVCHLAQVASSEALSVGSFELIAASSRLGDKLNFESTTDWLELKWQFTLKLVGWLGSAIRRLASESSRLSRAGGGSWNL